MDGSMKERMMVLSSSQNSVYFGITPLSFSIVNSHSTTHTQPFEEMRCSTVHDPRSLFQTPPMLSGVSDVLIANAIYYNPILYFFIPFPL